MKRPSPAAMVRLGAAALWVALAVRPARAALEAAMILQMAVQIPLLTLVGGMLAAGLRRCEPACLREADRHGIAGVILALCTLAFWMLPRALDGALADPRMEAAKLLGVPLLAGLPLASSWRRLPDVAKGFLAANMLSMVGTAGALYLAAPVRLCAYYRLDQQAAAGKGLIGVAAAAGLLWLIAALFGWRPHAAV